jgi:hypothetical protein
MVFDAGLGQSQHHVTVDKDGETVVPYPAAQVLEHKARRELGVPPGHTDAGIYGENKNYAVGAAALVGLLPAEPGCPTNELAEVGAEATRMMAAINHSICAPAKKATRRSCCTTRTTTGVAAAATLDQRPRPARDRAHEPRGQDRGDARGPDKQDPAPVARPVISART